MVINDIFISNAKRFYSVDKIFKWFMFVFKSYNLLKNTFKSKQIFILVYLEHKQ